MTQQASTHLDKAISRMIQAALRTQAHTFKQQIQALRNKIATLHLQNKPRQIKIATGPTLVSPPSPALWITSLQKTTPVQKPKQLSLPPSNAPKPPETIKIPIKLPAS
eukprot:TRINITY_DN22723_c0_g1_i1.p2 TRINITY_DN22723_c0_g1~~TRINITY_DN22723_c0_g1_i1.p2  ORF type:complete len:108 (-),score=14.15 TRINITY_DN22723_c0_g1_i1:172-495(-)